MHSLEPIVLRVPRRRRPFVRGALAAALLLPALLLPGLGGCTATHVVYVYEASLGIDVALSSEGTTKLSLGFDRQTFAIVPRHTPDNPDGTPGKQGDAMTLTAVSRVRAEGLSVVHFGHVVATGDAAKGIAKHPEQLQMLSQRVFEEAGAQVSTKETSPVPGVPVTPPTGVGS